MTNQENSGPETAQLNLSQSYLKNPLEWCRQLINQGLSGKYGDPAKMVSIIGRGLQLGLDPYTSLQSIYIVDGQSALSCDIMLALVERSGLLEDKRHNYTGEGERRACTVWIKRINRTIQAYGFSFAEARVAGLVKPGGGWIKYPDSMLYSRAMSFGLRREFPDVLRGIHSIEELHVEPDPPAYTFESMVNPPEPQKAVKPEGDETEPAPEEPPKKKRHRRTKAQMEAARGKPLVEVLSQEEVNQEDSSPPVSGEEKIDIDKAIPKETTPLGELLSRAFTASVSEEELLMAAKVLRLSFEETKLSALPENKVRTMLQNWPIVLGVISREKAKNVKAISYE